MVMKTKLLITAAAIVIFTALAGAQYKTTNQKQNTSKRGIEWVDTDNDGVCENLNAMKPAGNKSGYMRGSGQGQGRKMGMVQSGMGRGKGYNRNFIDADKNGICDLDETPAKK
jgi:hypothetical protein